jgi:hypothetical protein
VPFDFIEIAKLFRDYGPYGLSSVFAGVVVYIYKRGEVSTAERIKDAQDQRAAANAEVLVLRSSMEKQAATYADDLRKQAIAYAEDVKRLSADRIADQKGAHEAHLKTAESIIPAAKDLSLGLAALKALADQVRPTRGKREEPTKIEAVK